MKIFDKSRGRHLVLTPEEGVRRRVLAFLAGRIDPALIAQEYPIDLNGQPQRADIVVFGAANKASTETATEPAEPSAEPAAHSAQPASGNALRPVLLVECKAPGVRISAATLAQAHRYNAVLRARYVWLTNGADNYIYERAPDGNYLTLSEFPSLG